MLLMMLMVAVTWAKSDYCRISPKHTMCRYKGVSPSCHQHTEREGHFNLLTPPRFKDFVIFFQNSCDGKLKCSIRGVSEADKKEILEYHNRFVSCYNSIFNLADCDVIITFSSCSLQGFVKT